jgi:hypothetical protein
VPQAIRDPQHRVRNNITISETNEDVGTSPVLYLVHPPRGIGL